MKVKDFIMVSENSADLLTEKIKGLLKKGYELYGPPMMAQSQNLDWGTYYDRIFQKSIKPNCSYSQALILPSASKTLPVLEGKQNCANCSCSPNSTENTRACGRLE